MTKAISFENVGKMYDLGVVGTGMFFNDIHRWFKTAILHQEDPYMKVSEVNDRSKAGNSKYVWALKDITFDVEEGDVVGIIGKNGAGKSTLLKLLSRVTGPTTGTIKAKGRIASLLEVGTGFHPELTGRENIYMNGAILGMTKAEIKSKLDEIIDFSGCERYIDTPVKRYSSGMMVRLGFAVAAHLEPEILVVDEVLAVGDAEFQKKAIGKMKDVSKGDGRTVLFVSHNMGSIRSLCKNGILLKDGMVVYTGEVNDVVDKYIQVYNLDNISSMTITDANRDGWVSKDLEIVAAEMLNDVNQVATDEPLRFVLTIKRNNKKIEKFTIGAHIMNSSDQCDGTTVSQVFEVPRKEIFDVEMMVFDHNLVKGHYMMFFNIGLKIVAAGLRDYDVVKNVLAFDVVYQNMDKKEPYALWQNGWGDHYLGKVDYIFR
jgi:lipopolysaccharide transport system ATP-binding protein